MIITIQVKNERDGSERALQINVNSEKAKIHINLEKSKVSTSSLKVWADILDRWLCKTTLKSGDHDSSVSNWTGRIIFLPPGNKPHGAEVGMVELERMQVIVLI